MGHNGTRAGQGLVFAQAAGVVREVEHRGDLGLAAVHDDGDLVHRLEPDGLGRDVGDGGGVSGVLEIDDVVGRSAAGKVHDQQAERGANDGFHEGA